MVRSRFARAALVPRRKTPVRATFGVFLGLGGCVVGVLLAASLEIPRTDLGYTEGYVRAAQAGAMARAIWACLLFSAGAAYVGASLRRAFGLPERERNKAWTVARFIVASLCLVRLWAWGLVGEQLRFINPDASPNISLLLALVVWAMIAAGIPWMVRDAVECLRARLTSVLAKSARLASLPNSATVRVSGTVAAGPDTLPGGLIYRDDLEAETRAPQAVPFLLEDGGHRAWIDLHPHNARVVANLRNSTAIEIWVGDEVTVVGLASGADEPYRGGLRRISNAPDRPLHIMAGSEAWNRRLLIAAVVEIVAASTLVGAAALLAVFRLVLG